MFSNRDHVWLIVNQVVSDIYHLYVSSQKSSQLPSLTILAVFAQDSADEGHVKCVMFVFWADKTGNNYQELTHKGRHVYGG